MLTQKGALTLSELSSQGDVWKQVIQTVDKEQQKSSVVHERGIYCSCFYRGR